MQALPQLDLFLTLPFPTPSTAHPIPSNLQLTTFICGFAPHNHIIKGGLVLDARDWPEQHILHLVETVQYTKENG